MKLIGGLSEQLSLAELAHHTKGLENEHVVSLIGFGSSYEHLHYKSASSVCCMKAITCRN